MRENDMNDQRKESLKQLPKIDELMIILKSRGIYKHASKDLVLRVCRETVEELGRLFWRRNRSRSQSRKFLPVFSTNSLSWCRID